MKTTILSVFVYLLCFAACSQSTPEPETIRKKYSVQFHIQPAPEILPFQPTKSIPGGIPPEPGTSTPEGGGDATRLFTQIEYIVYDKESSEQIHKKQFTEDGNEDFGTFLYDEFESGSYTICILAHSVEDVSFAGNTVNFDNVSDAFFATREINIDGSQDQTVEIVLHRIVSRVEFVATDDIPQPAAQLHLQISGLYNTFNFFTGETGNTPSEHSLQYSFTATDKLNSSKHKTSFLTLVPAGIPASIKEVTLETLDSDNYPLYTQTLKNIPLYVNRTTRYTGTLFPTGLINGTFELSVENNGAWGEEVVYPAP